MIAVIVFCLGLVTGTASTILSKLLYSLKGENLDGEEVLFQKPLFQTLMMFIAMSLAIPAHFAIARYQGHSGTAGLSKKLLSLLMIPACTDLIATALANMGLVYINVSIFQLMKCAVIIFVAVLKRTVLKHVLKGYEWLGVLLNMMAVLMVAASSLLGPSAEGSDSDKQTLGVCLVLASCLVQSIQYVFEEKVMGEMAAPPLVVIGMEGVWGSLMCVAVVLPLAQFVISGKDVGGVYENTNDTLHMISSSSAIMGLTAAYVVVITGYNMAAIFVTYLLDSVWHAILDNFRPVTVWVTDLVLYVITAHAFGEAWTKMSYLQLGGLAMLLFGTAVYNGSIKMPCMCYDEEYDVIDESYLDLEGASACSPPGSVHSVRFRDADGNLKKIYASPMLSRSPFVMASMLRAQQQQAAADAPPAYLGTPLSSINGESKAWPKARPSFEEDGAQDRKKSLIGRRWNSVTSA